MLHTHFSAATFRRLRCDDHIIKAPGHVRPRLAFTRAEVITVSMLMAVFGFLILGWCLRPRVTICREISRRVVCMGNLRAIGRSMQHYALANGGAWPAPAFDESAVGHIRYTIPVGGGAGTNRSPDRTQPSRSGPDGARELSTSRLFWMLIRSGETIPKTYVCPVSGDTPNPSKDIGKYYDFVDGSHLSYGVHIPFGPPMTRLGDWMDPRLPIAADRGPYVDATVPSPPAPLTDKSDRKVWAPFNSLHSHGFPRDGQSVIFADMHIDFALTPLVGIDHDNIYTVARNNAEGDARIRGESPWIRSAPPHAPVDRDGRLLPTTDSVIFP